MEAGHRCAIPTCRNHPVQIDHIDDWSRVAEHRFDNLLALCGVCHDRKGNGPGQIDRKSLIGYKGNLGTVTRLYSDMERRILEDFAQRRHDGKPFGEIELPYLMDFMVAHLRRDGLLHIVRQSVGIVFAGESPTGYALTEAGEAFVDAMLAAEPVGKYFEGADIPEYP